MGHTSPSASPLPRHNCFRKEETKLRHKEEFSVGWGRKHVCGDAKIRIPSRGPQEHPLKGHFMCAVSETGTGAKGDQAACWRPTFQTVGRLVQLEKSLYCFRGASWAA